MTIRTKAAWLIQRYLRSRFSRFLSREEFPNGGDVAAAIAMIGVIVIVVRSADWQLLLIVAGIGAVLGIVGGVLKLSHPRAWVWWDRAFFLVTVFVALAGITIMVKEFFFTGEFVTWEFVLGLLIFIHAELGAILYRLGQLSSLLPRQ